jgi:hypothetical protein
VVQIERAHVGNSPSKFARASILSRQTDTGKPPFKASEGGCFENLRVSEDITSSEFQQGKGTRVPIRPKVRLEAFPNGLPMFVSSKVYGTLR